MIERGRSDLAIGQQCQLLSISRSTFHAAPRGESDTNLAIMATIDRQFLEAPFYGVRQMAWHLRAKGWQINVKRARRLAGLRHAPGMTVLLAAQDGPDADLSTSKDQHSGARTQDLPLPVARPCDRSPRSGPPSRRKLCFRLPVKGCTDITYILLARGFL